MNQNDESRLKSLLRFINFLDYIEEESSPGAPLPLHTQITFTAIEHLFQNYLVPTGALVLDIGCGHGGGMQRFQERGCRAVGITLDNTDLVICHKLGLTVAKMDQSFLDFDDATFDILWARHVIEHSIFPFFTLSGYRRVHKTGGLLYLEVPSAESVMRHEFHSNHYSILSRSMWQSLLERCGYEILEETTYHIKTDKGPDEYWAFFARAGVVGQEVEGLSMPTSGRGRSCAAP